MPLLWYGVKHANIGMDEFLVKCPSCEADKYADVMITSNYFHICWIPIFPFEKEAHLICQECGLKRYNFPFTAKNFKNYDEVKDKYRHPWYTYLFVGFIAALIIIGILVSL